MTIVTQLSKSEYNAFYQTYIDNIPKEKSLGILFMDNFEELMSVFDRLSPAQLNFRYEEGKWSVAEVLQHLIDVERIFQFRALSISRGEQQPLLGFDHENYAASSEADKRNLEDLKLEFKFLRKSTDFLFNSFSENMLKQVGQMNGASVTTRGIGFIIVGHTRHHIKILEERYKI